ncbi:T9SS type A sorting domain-containing protein [Flammeovirga sp. EKP202]|uniref:T9SS type A sorting domain-containing protein n=1 Tax=Flammeovirga sp. EKP202 TaxID=2770592 RepID=UPI00165FB548|nr:T9SS type A sorting domain-containing protein [Flammeovirga sp. EKP202]MBD0403271.1 T9SS type A sorting domain-containing protein [Flammeovirga sp. EKP202]
MQTTTFLKRITYLLLLIGFNPAQLMADPPDPPAGKVWVLNHAMSDEFDANSPNTDKWRLFDKADSWGRTAAFDKRILAPVKDPNSDNYYMSMNPMWYYEDERFPRGNGKDYYFAGGGMDTKVLQTYGYFEVRVKPSDFPMGSGVFMNSRGTTTDDCNTKYATELDIIENMGYTGPFNEHGDGSFNNIQHVNSHSKPFSDANGSCERLPFESTNSGVKAPALAEPLGWNTVGMWWKDANTAMFYNDNEYFGTITPTRDYFLPMPVIIVMETYNWGDDDERNATNPKPEEWMFEDDFRTKQQRAVMYDWVRVWKLVDIDEATFNNSTDNIKSYDESITAYPSYEFSSTLIYSASAARTVTATLYDPSNNVLGVKSYNVEQGVKSIFSEFDLDEELSIGSDYKVVYEIKEDNSVLKTSTITFDVIEKPLEKKLWSEGIPTSLLPGQNSYPINVKYEADEPCKINIEIRKPDGSWFGSGNVNVEAGNSTATVNVRTNSAAPVGSNYFYKVYMHRQGFDWRDPEAVSVEPVIYFNVEDAIVPAIDLLTVPTELEGDATEVNVEFSYGTYENGTLTIELLDKDNNVMANEIRTERIGQRTLTRTIKVNQELPAVDDYKIKIEFTPENDSFEKLTDEVGNIKVNEVITSIEEVDVKDTVLKVYPNPVGETLKIELKDNTETIEKIEVLNIAGRQLKLILPQNEPVTEINVSNLTSGAYLLKVTSGNEVYTTRFVKK